MKVKVLYFVTEKIIKMKKIRLDEKTGTAKIGQGKQFQFDDTRPLMIETGLFRKSLKPIYIIKHDIHKPLDVKFRVNRKTGDEETHMVVTPENFKNMMTQGTLNTLLTLTTSFNSQMIMFIMIGAAIGFLLGQVIPIGSFTG